MRQERTRPSGIVSAVSLAMLVALVVIVLLIQGQNVTMAARHAEDTSKLLSSEMSLQLVTSVNEQEAPVMTGLSDDEVCDVLMLEQEGASPEEVCATLTRTLQTLSVDPESSVICVGSLRTHTVYRSDGSYTVWDERGTEAAWIHEIIAGGSGTQHRVIDPWSIPGPDTFVFSGRPLYRDDTAIGVIGAIVRTSSLSKVMNKCRKGLDVNVICFSEAGTALFCTDDAIEIGQNVFSRYPQLAGIRRDFTHDDEKVEKVWVGLEGLFPRNQLLLEVRYFREFDAYLLTVNAAKATFDDMRSRSSTLVFALCVLMALLTLLVMTSIRWYRSRLVRAATTDELTGLANRKSFVSSYEKLIQRGPTKAMTLALIDVDRFKQINDTFGHAGGDRALSAIAAEVHAMTGSDGLAGRWGGDEFIGVLCGAGDRARDRVEEMIARIAALEIEGGIKVSVSVGTTEIDTTDTLEHIVEQADDALYVTKEGGRGFLTVYEPGVTPHIMSGESSAPSTTAPTPARSISRSQQLAQSTSRGVAGAERLAARVARSLLEAVRKMVPFVAGGGVLIAIAFLIDGTSIDLNMITAEQRASFGSITPIAAGLNEVGSAAFNFMLPIFAAFFARELEGDEAFMAGFAGGFLASQGSSGFAGAIGAAVASAVVVRLMRNFIDETSVFIKRIAPVMLYPVFSLLLMYLFMRFVTGPLASSFDALLTSMLESLLPGNRIMLGAVSGGMMATDMGGPINKAAYHFGVASIANGSPEIMAAVMLGGMVPPCGIALSMLLFRDCYTDAEHDTWASTLFMGLSFITEGAIPFVLTDVLRVIPSCMVGATIAGALSVAFGCTLMAPHGGIFVFPVVNNPFKYLFVLALGSLATAVTLGLLKRYAHRPKRD